MAPLGTTQEHRLTNEPASRNGKILVLGRVLFAVAAAAFGVLHFVYPAFAAAVQPMWSSFTGIAFLAAALAIFLDSRFRLAATFFGTLILLFALVVWVPWLAVHPQDIAGGNYLKDMGLAGGALLLAGALPKKGG